MRIANPQKEEQTKAEIVQAAKRVFQAYGMEKATMEDIGRAAGKGTSTLYYYFKNKDEVFYTVVRSEFYDVYGKIHGALSKCKTAREKLRTLQIARYDEFKKKMVQYSSVVQELPRITMLTRLQNISSNMEIETLRGILQEGLDSGEFKHLKKQDIDSIVICVMMFWRALVTDLALSKKFPPDSLRIETMVDVLVRGLQ